MDCVVCFERYKDPRVLPCGHSFCKGCIQRLIDDDESKCPCCKKLFCAVGGKAEAFTPNYMLTCAAVDDSKPRSCSSARIAEAELCQMHSQPSKFFCETCGSIICETCVVGSRHKGHVFLHYSKTFRESRLRLASMKQKAEQLMKKINAIIKDPMLSRSDSTKEFNSAYQKTLAQYDLLIQIAQSAKEKFLKTAESAFSDLVREARSKYNLLLDRTKAVVDATGVRLNGLSLMTLIKIISDADSALQHLEKETDSVELSRPHCSFLPTTIADFTEVRNSIQERLKILEEQQKLLVPVVLNDYESDLLLCFGGSPNECENQVLAYDTTSSKWYSGRDMRHARFNVAATAWKSRVVVAGGNGPDSSDTYLNIVEQYDPQYNRWTTFSRLLEGRNEHALVNLNGSLFVIGGHSGKECLCSVERLDSDRKIWRAAPELAVARAGLAASTLQNYIVVAGGYNDALKHLDSCELYDSRLDSWRRIAALNKKRCNAAAATHGKAVFVFGGMLTSKELHDDAEHYDRAANKWTVLDARMSVGRYGHAATVVKDAIYILGGLSSSSSGYVDLVDCFDVTVKQFLSKFTLPRACGRLAAVSLRVQNDVVGRLSSLGQ